jgi:hypothetical protein
MPSFITLPLVAGAGPADLNYFPQKTRHYSLAGLIGFSLDGEVALAAATHHVEELAVVFGGAHLL